MEVFATGVPIGVTSSPGAHRHQVTSTAASVGPYRLWSSGARSPPKQSKKRFTRSDGSASPLQRTRWSDPHEATVGSSRKMRSSEGTKWTVVIRSSRKVRTRYELSLCRSGSAITKVAPQINGQKNSQTETSKLNGVFCRTRSFGERP